MAHTCEMPLLHHATEICDAAFDWLYTAVPSWIQHQLGSARQLGRLRGMEPKIHLERDPLLRVPGARVAAEIVLAGGEKNGCCVTQRAVIERSLPEAGGCVAERLHAATSFYAHPHGDRLGNERCIERLARKRGRGEW